MGATGTRAPASPSSQARPFEDFVLPGRRRTDHPLVVGTIVLCLGLSAIASVVQIGVTAWAGWQVKTMIVAQHTRDAESEAGRRRFTESQTIQIQLLLRHCIHAAQTEAEKTDCLQQIKPVVVVPQK